MVRPRGRSAEIDEMLTIAIRNGAEEEELVKTQKTSYDDANSGPRGEASNRYS